MNISKSVSDTPEYKALQSYLSTTDPESQTSTLEALTSKTNTLISSSPKDHDAIEASLTTTWDALLLTAATSSKAQDNLVSLLLHLQKQNAEFKLADNQHLWHDLPLLGRQVREHMNFDASKAQHDSSLKNKWTNVNAFLAKLTQASLSGSETVAAGDFSLYAIWMLREGLEEEGAGDVEIEVAGVWIQEAAEAIWGLCRENKTFEGKRARAGAKVDGKEWRGFCEERWGVWREEFGRVGRREVVQIMDRVAGAS